MRNDDDDEVGFDLTAWEAPPPPAGIAEAVIARVTAPSVAGAIEPSPPRSSRWWIAGGIAAVIAGAISIALLSRGEEETGFSSGAVATAKPSHLELGGTAIDLEAHTDIWWVRDGKQVVAMQPRGAATWKVGATEQLRIDAGATGASVSASGASLRVEVDMNLSDVRLIGASAVTAAAVSLVTVIVYEGHVKVTSADKTVEVAAGTTVQIAANQPPVEREQTSGREERLESKIKFLELENQLLRNKLEADALTERDLNNFRAVMKPLDAKLKKCRLGSTATEMTVHVEVLARGGLELGFEAEPDAKAETVECAEQVLSSASFAALTLGEYSYDVVFEVVRPPGPVTARNPRVVPVKPPVPVAPAPVTPRIDCSNKTLVAELDYAGDNHLKRGEYAKALAAFEQVLQCNPKVVTKAYLVACKSRSYAKAKVYFKTIGKDSLAQICLKENFDPR